VRSDRGPPVGSCWRVAILDSGLADPSDSLRAPIASRRFVDTGREVLEGPVLHDAIGHGTAVSDVICGASRSVELLVAQVLDHQRVTTAAALAAAVTWSLEKGARLIHMSLGLRADRPILAMAVNRAVQAGCIVVASAPARGPCTFPASYPHVIRVTGDARCRQDEISALDSAQADFGACARRGGSNDTDSGSFGGASLGAAHLTRLVLERIAPGSDVSAVRTQLRALARYRGIEDRTRQRR
jgi:subtilisin family serine protease